MSPGLYLTVNGPSRTNTQVTRPAFLLGLFLLAILSGPFHVAVEEHFWIDHHEESEGSHPPHAAVEHDTGPMTRWNAEFTEDLVSELAGDLDLAPNRETPVDFVEPVPTTSSPPPDPASRAPPAC
jgi:hypothetical protein